MLLTLTPILILKVILVTVPVLLTVAFVTVVEVLTITSSFYNSCLHNTYINIYANYIYIITIVCKTTKIIEENWINWSIHCFNLIRGSIIVKTIAYIITLLLVRMGLEYKTASIFASGLIIFLIIYSCCKSKNKVKYMWKLTVNLCFLVLFWSSAYSCIDQGIILGFLINYAMYNFGDWDFDIDLSSIMDQFEFHNKGMNDPSVRPPNIDPLHFDGHSGDYDEEKDYYPEVSNAQWNTFEKDNDYLKHNKKYMTFKGIKLRNTDLSNSIDFNNKLFKPVDLKNSVMCKIGRLIMLQSMESENNILSTYDIGGAKTNFPMLSPEECVNYMKQDLYVLTQEYNTLKWAKAYYVSQEKEFLPEKYKKSFEHWQKRQLKFYYPIHALGAYDNYYKSLFSNPKFYSSKYYHNVLPAHYELSNYFLDEQVFFEIRENLLWVKLRMINIAYVLDKIKDVSSKNITYEHLNHIMFKYEMECFHKCKNAYNVMGDYWKYILIEKNSHEMFMVMFKAFLEDTFWFYSDEYKASGNFNKHIWFSTLKDHLFENNIKTQQLKDKSPLGLGFASKMKGFNFHKVFTKYPKTQLLSEPFPIELSEVKTPYYNKPVAYVGFQVDWVSYKAMDKTLKFPGMFKQQTFYAYSDEIRKKWADPGVDG